MMMELDEQQHRGRRHVVLVGGGHANVQVMLALADALTVADDTRVTLISTYTHAYYSGMMPGCVAGLYDESEVRMNLKALATWCRMSFVRANVTHIDRDARVVCTDHPRHPRVPYDYVAINIGSATRGTTDTPGVAEFALPTRPISEMMGKINAFERRFFTNDDNGDGGKSVRAFVVGGGAAGVELCMTLHARWLRRRPAPHVDITLVDDHAHVLGTMGGSVSRVTSRALAHAHVRVMSESRVTLITADQVSVHTRGVGVAEHAYDVVVWATGAAAHATARAYDVMCDVHGYMRVRRTMQSVSDDRIFAAGDCCAIDDCPFVAKAGVYAVRQGPVVTRNILAMLRQRPLNMYAPQHGFLALLADGDGAAIVRYKGYSFYARWCWWLKDWIDRGFMRRFDTRYMGRSRSQLEPFYDDDDDDDDDLDDDADDNR